MGEETLVLASTQTKSDWKSSSGSNGAFLGQELPLLLRLWLMFSQIRRVS
jgi:hypothetical protein